VEGAGLGVGTPANHNETLTGYNRGMVVSARLAIHGPGPLQGKPREGKKLNHLEPAEKRRIGAPLNFARVDLAAVEEEKKQGTDWPHS